jgi:hypothetical protein
MAWEPAEQVAKNAAGEYVGLIGGQWTPVQQAAKSADGRYMVFRPDVAAAVPAPAQKPAAPFVPSGEKDQLSWSSPEVIAGQPLLQLAKGAASPLLGLLQLGANLGPDGPGTERQTFNEHMKRYEELNKAGNPEGLGWRGMPGAETAGEILSPVWLKAAKAIPAGQRLLSRTAQAIGFGAAGGASAPVTEGDDYWDQKATDTGVGAATGGVIPGAAKVIGGAGKIVYHGLIEPWAKPAAIKGRAYLEAAGDKVKQISDLLTENRQIVPGSAPTAGEAAAPAKRAEFSALQESAAKAKPSEYFARGEEQNAARIEALNEFAGNPAKRAEAAAQRSARAAPHYEAGVNQTAPTSGLKDLAERPSTGAVLKRAERLMEEKDKSFAPLFPNGLPRQMSGEEAQAVKLAFDDMIKLHPKSAMDTAEVEAIKATRNEFVGWMEKNFPELGRGRKLYKMGSGPVNEMDTGEALVEKLTPALRATDTPRSTAFANAVRDSASTIKKATGEPRFEKLEQVLTNRSLQTTHNVADDLARQDLHKDLGRAGSKAAPDAIALATHNLQSQLGGPPPTLLHRGVMLANAIINRLEGRVNKKLAAEMAAEMLNPPGVAKSLAEAQARDIRNKAIADAIQHYQRPAIAGGASAIAQGGQ